MNQARLALRSAVLDPNLLLLFLVAKTDRTLLRTFKRVQVFVEPDLEALDILLRCFHSVITTPNMLTETSNFASKAPRMPGIASCSPSQISRLRPGRSMFPSKTLVSKPGFHSFGLSDAALQIASTQYVVITMDYRLAGLIQASGGSCINFNHHRAAYL